MTIGEIDNSNITPTVNFILGLSLYFPEYWINFLQKNIFRYISISRPLSSINTVEQKKRAKIMVIVAWILTLLFASPQAIIFRVLKHPEKEFYQCTTYNFFESLASEERFDILIEKNSWSSQKIFVNWNFQQQNIHVVSHSPIEFAQKLKKFFF